MATNDVNFNLNIDSSNADKSLKDLEKELGNVEKQAKDTTKELDKTNNEIKETGEETKKSSKELSDSKSKFSDLSNETKNLANQWGLLPGPLNKVISSFQGITKAANVGTGSMKLLKVAIASTGIGLLLVAVGSLIAYFKRTEEGASKLQQIIAPFKVIFQNILDIVGKFGGVIISAFENPKKAISDLWDSLKQNLINRIEASIDVFRGLGKVIEGVFKLDIDQIKEGAKEAGNAFVDSFTGVRDTIGKATEAIKSFAEESKKEADIAIQLEKDKLKLQQDRRKFQEDEAKAQEKISELLLKSRDLELSAAERQKALIEAKNIQNELSDEALRLAKEDLRIKETAASLSDSDAETLQEITDAKVELSRVEKERNDKLRTYTQQEKTIIKEQEAEAKRIKDQAEKDNEEELKRIEEHNNKILELQKSFKDRETELRNQWELEDAETEQEKYELQLEQEQERFETYLETLNGDQELIRIATEEHNLNMEEINRNHNKKILENEKKNEQERIKQKIATLSAFASLSAQLSSVFSEDTAAHKLFATASVILDTVAGIQSVFANPLIAPPNPIGIATIATISTTGALGLSKIAGVQFATGGMLEGPSHQDGGILSPFGELEGGESVINKVSMSQPTLRNLASAINVVGGGRDFSVGSGNISMDLNQSTIDLIINGINDKKVFVLENDITEKQKRVAVYESNSLL